MQLRDYQQESVEKTFEYWARHPGADQIPILWLPTAAGKSVICAGIIEKAFREWPEHHPRSLVIVPSKELAEQNAEKLAKVLPDNVRLGFYSASVGKKQPDADVIVATIGSVAKAAHVLGNIKLVIVDECFTGDTMIATPEGPRPIAEIKPGDEVLNATGTGKVLAVSKRVSKVIYRIRLSNGSEIRATGNHPFFTNTGWREAKDLARGMGVLRIQDMRELWGRVSPVVQEAQHWEWGECQTSPLVREAAFLLNLLLKEEGKCHVGAWGKGKNGGYATPKRPPAAYPWWEWARINGTSTASAFDFGGWLAAGTCDTNWRSEKRGDIPDMLQGGRCQPATQDCDRARRSVTLRQAEDIGCEEGQPLGFVRVESVTREESGCAESVYNLQVSGHPSYFAGGILVHNCHLINPDGAGMYRTLLRDLSKYCRFRAVGMTATPFRGNGVWLTDGKDPLFTGIAHQVPMSLLLERGYLSPLVRPVDVLTTIDTTGIRTTNGDYNVAQLSERVSAYLAGVATQTVALAADRKKWIAFTPDVATAHQLAGLLTDLGAPSQVVTGETPKLEREAITNSFRRKGDIRCLVSVLALTTGFDVPAVDCVIWCRPTKSPVLYCFDTETEILTSGGWKRWDEVREGDCALAMDTETGKGKWSRVLGVVHRQMRHDEKWVSYDAPRANFRVTDQHRMIFKLRNRKSNEWRVDTAINMAGYNDNIYMPTAVHVDQPGVPLNDDELWLIGMLMSDGTWSDVQAAISQSERYPHILEKIENTLNNLNIYYSKRKITAPSNYPQRFDRWVFTISMNNPRKAKEKRGIRYLMPFLDKDFSPALLALSRSQFVALVGGLWDGDGVKNTYVKDWTPRGKTIVSARKMCIERIQAAAVVNGFTAHLRWETKGRKNPLGIISIHDKDWRSIGGGVGAYERKRRPSVEVSDATNEMVWCVETEHGTVVTRRKGKVTVMGNCQGAGRGMRISPETGKTDCLWLDFTDTTSRLGPIDQIRGRARSISTSGGEAPFAVCDNCGAQVVPASLLRCPECDHLMREPEEAKARDVSDAPIMSSQVRSKIVRYEVTDVTYSRHQKPGKPPSMRVSYWSGPRIVANEFICLEHGGYAASRAYNWWTTRAPGRPGGVDEALDWIRQGCPVARPIAIHVNETGKYPEVVKYEFEPAEKAA